VTPKPTIHGPVKVRTSSGLTGLTVPKAATGEFGAELGEPVFAVVRDGKLTYIPAERVEL